MRKTHIAGLLALVLALAVAFPTMSAGTIVKDKYTWYTGTVAPSGIISFRVGVRVVRLKNGKKHVSRGVSKVTFSAPTTCPDGPRTVSGGFGPGVKLFRMWHLNGLPIRTGNGAVADINGSRTAGTIRVHGDLDTTPAGRGCDSGLLSWTAARK